MTLLLTSRAAMIQRGQPVIRRALSVLYFLASGKDGLEDQKRIHTALSLSGKDITLHGICFGIYSTPAEALVRNPECKSLVPKEIVLVSGLHLQPSVDRILQVLAETCVASLCGEVQVLSLHNTNSSNKELRYLALLGAVQIGQVNVTDESFLGISAEGSRRFDIRVALGELRGQAELRRAIQNKPSSSPKPSSAPSPTPASTAIVKRNSTPRSAWDTALEKYSPPDTSNALTSQSLSTILAKHTEDISQLAKSQQTLSDQVSEQGKLLTKLVTMDAMEALVNKLLAGKNQA